MFSQKMKAAAYCRTSREYKNYEKVSNDQQAEDAKKLAAEKKWQLDVQHIYVDADYSSKLPPKQFAKPLNKTRPALTAMLDAITRGEVTIVIVRKRDRLARPLKLALEILEFLDEHGVELVCTNECSYGKDASGQFGIKSMLLHAEYELARTSENILAAKKYQREHGMKMCGARSIGYKDGKQREVVIDETVRPLVKQIFEKTLEGLSAAKIARWLNTEHRKQAVGKHWHNVSVYRLLRDVRVIGLKRDGSGVDPIYPPLIDAPLFHRVQEIIKGRKGSKQGKKTRHLLSGILRCGYCNLGLGFVVWDNIEYYSCINHHVPHTIRPFSMPEKEWLAFLLAFYDVPILESSHEISPDAARLTMQRERLDRQLGELVELLDKKELTTTAYAAATNALDKSKAEVDAKIATLPSTSGHAYQEFNLCKTIDEKRIWLRERIRSVTVYKYSVEVEGFDGRSYKKISYPLLKRTNPDSIRPRYCLVPLGFKAHVKPVDWARYAPRNTIQWQIAMALNPKQRRSPSAVKVTIKDGKIDWSGVLPKDVKVATPKP